MSDTTASLRRKIGSAGELQTVVRTMKAVAGKLRDWAVGERVRGRRSDA